MSKNIHSSQWFGTEDACKLLGLSRSTIQKLKTAGHFKPGIHWYRRGIGRTAPTAWDVEACRAVLQVLAAADPAELETFDDASMPDAAG